MEMADYLNPVKRLLVIIAARRKFLDTHGNHQPFIMVFLQGFFAYPSDLREVTD
jgi:hypothetical protein